MPQTSGMDLYLVLLTGGLLFTPMVHAPEIKMPDCEEPASEYFGVMATLEIILDLCLAMSKQISGPSYMLLSWCWKAMQALCEYSH